MARELLPLPAEHGSDEELAVFCSPDQTKPPPECKIADRNRRLRMVSRAWVLAMILTLDWMYAGRLSARG